MCVFYPLAKYLPVFETEITDISLSWPYSNGYENFLWKLPWEIAETSRWCASPRSLFPKDRLYARYQDVEEVH